MRSMIRFQIPDTDLTKITEYPDSEGSELLD